jgi:sulfite reductase alpha subunit-like flavoprotein
MIMIGPGTGIAPFRGFLQERRALDHTGPNWLFFGEQHAATDYYYRDEIEAMHADGFLTELDLAFSRDRCTSAATPTRWLKTSIARSAKLPPNTATSIRTPPRPTSSR